MTIHKEQCIIVDVRTKVYTTLNNESLWRTDNMIKELREQIKALELEMGKSNVGDVIHELTQRTLHNFGNLEITFAIRPNTVEVVNTPQGIIVEWEGSVVVNKEGSKYKEHDVRGPRYYNFIYSGTESVVEPEVSFSNVGNVSANSIDLTTVLCLTDFVKSLAELNNTILNTVLFEIPNLADQAIKVYELKKQLKAETLSLRTMLAENTKKGTTFLITDTTNNEQHTLEIVKGIKSLEVESTLQHEISNEYSYERGSLINRLVNLVGKGYKVEVK